MITRLTMLSLVAGSLIAWSAPAAEQWGVYEPNSSPACDNRSSRSRSPPGSRKASGPLSSPASGMAATRIGFASVRPPRATGATRRHSDHSELNGRVGSFTATGHRRPIMARCRCSRRSICVTPTAFRITNSAPRATHGPTRPRTGRADAADAGRSPFNKIRICVFPKAYG